MKTSKFSKPLLSGIFLLLFVTLDTPINFEQVTSRYH
jgi:hypothetical protein